MLMPDSLGTIDQGTTTVTMPLAAGPTLRRHLMRWSPIVIILVVGFAVSYGAYLVARTADDHAVLGALELRTEWRTHDIQQKVVIALDSLEALAVFAALQNPMPPDAFHGFAHLSHDEADANSALVWAPVVRAADRDAFVMTQRRSNANFDIVERRPDGGFAAEPERGDYLPTIYEENYDGAPGVLGLDQLSLPERRLRVERARDEGRPIATPSVPVFVSKTEKRLGFFVFWPVYAGGDVPATLEERRTKFIGVAASRFRFDQLLPAVIKNTPPVSGTLEFFLDPGRNGEAPVLIGRYDASFNRITYDAPDAAAAQEGVTLNREFDILGRHWTLRFRYAPETVGALRSQDPLWVLSLGLALTAILAAYAWRERTRRMSVEQIVALRTSDLAAANGSLSHEVDVRRKVEAEAEGSLAVMRATLDAAPFAIVTRGLDRRVLSWNRAAEQMLGYAASEVIGQIGTPWSDDFDNRIAERIECLGRGEEIHGERAQQRRKDGTIIEVRVGGAPIYQDGQIIGICGVLEDVTDRVLIEKQLVQAQKMEAIGTLTGGIAHDFNNLLAVVIGDLDLLKEQLPSVGEARELVDEAFSAALSGAELTRWLLTFARRQPLTPQRVEINELVGGLIKLLSRTLGEQIKISLNLESDIWPVVIDPAQLESSIANLATNARDAMPQGGRMVIVTANRHLDEDYAEQHPEASPGDYAMIEVTDTGTGMTADVMTHIFEPFYTTKERGKGTGLGLSMVFGFIKQSAGHINVYSEPGKGTTFRLYLPRADASATSVDEAAFLKLQRGMNETILVVEDNPALRRVVVRQIADLGYRVLEAEDAASALEILEAGKVDLMFSDVVMPGAMDGFALAQRVSAIWPAVKVVLTSGFPETSMNTTPVAATGNVRLLSKPYRKEDLATVLRTALHN
jgi:PAS domain S-box-containing protein